MINSNIVYCINAYGCSKNSALKPLMFKQKQAYEPLQTQATVTTRTSYLRNTKLKTELLAGLEV